MKYLFTDLSNVIFEISDMCVDADDRWQVEEFLYVQKSDGISVTELESIPDNIAAIKYCYTQEQGFYINPNWVEPTDINQEVLKIKEENESLEFTSLDLNVRVSVIEMMM